MQRANSTSIPALTAGRSQSRSRAANQSGSRTASQTSIHSNVHDHSGKSASSKARRPSRSDSSNVSGLMGGHVRRDSDAHVQLPDSRRASRSRQSSQGSIQSSRSSKASHLAEGSTDHVSVRPAMKKKGSSASSVTSGTSTMSELGRAAVRERLERINNSPAEIQEIRESIESISGDLDELKEDLKTLISDPWRPGGGYLSQPVRATEAEKHKARNLLKVVDSFKRYAADQKLLDRLDKEGFTTELDNILNKLLNIVEGLTWKFYGLTLGPNVHCY